MGEPKSITIHEARQNVDGPLYLRVDDIWYRLTRLGMPQPPLDKTRPVRLVLDPDGRTPDPAELSPVLMSEQEIRARALGLAQEFWRNMRVTSDAVDVSLYDVADGYVAYIRDGSKPNARP
jgi:hypothetical protein